MVTGSIGVSGCFFFAVARPLAVVAEGGTVAPFVVAFAAFGGAELMKKAEDETTDRLVVVVYLAVSGFSETFRA